MTKLQRLIRRPASERGFTLIELLVVIIILGILAAVVVFAVNGVGDKGKSSAVAIDERTLQTAQEAYCAKNGSYGSGQQLIDGQFLSDKPQYHDVYARQDGGPCNGWSFSIAKTPKGDPDSGKWVAAANVPLPGNTWVPIRLRNGKVIDFIFDFTTGILGTAEWDWATAQWTPRDSIPIDSGTSPVNHPVLIEDDPLTSASECGTNCGKILLRTRHCGAIPDPACQPWFLFNPQTGQWENLTSSATPIRASFNLSMMLQLHDDPNTPGNQCGANCGKVLLRSNNFPEFELYDPKKANSDPTAFTAFSYSDAVAQGLSQGAALTDGRVLLFSGLQARLLDPATLQVDPAASPIYDHGGAGVRWPLLPNGEVLVTPSSSQTQIYTPAAAGPGSWRPIAAGSGCPTGGASPRCHMYGSLGDGRVIGFSSTNSARGFTENHTGKAWIFDPVQNKWLPTANLLDRRTREGVLLDPRTGPCGAYCNKFLVVGNNDAPNRTALYTP